MYECRIAGTGRYVPERILSNKDLEDMVDTSDEWIIQRTGIRERHIAAENESTSDLALQAAQSAMEEAGLDPLDLDAVILATLTPDAIFCILHMACKRNAIARALLPRVEANRRPAAGSAPCSPRPSRAVRRCAAGRMESV